MGASMVSRDFSFTASDFADGCSTREAIDGFSAIAAALDQGMDATGNVGGKIADAVAIGLGWLVLAAIIFYPSLQLVAIAACGAFMCMRSFSRIIFGPSASYPSRAGGRTFLAA